MPLRGDKIMVVTFDSVSIPDVCDVSVVVSPEEQGEPGQLEEVWVVCSHDLEAAHKEALYSVGRLQIAHANEPDTPPVELEWEQAMCSSLRHVELEVRGGWGIRYEFKRMRD